MPYSVPGPTAITSVMLRSRTHARRPLLTATALGVVAMWTVAACASNSPVTFSAPPVVTVSPTAPPAPSAAPTPSPSASVKPSSGPGLTGTVVHNSPAPSHTHTAPDVLPRIGAITITPRDIHCAGGARPVVTVQIIDPDDAPATLHVTLDYSMESTYGGHATMTYDPGRKLFVYHLPTVQPKDLDADGGFLNATVTVTDRSGGPRPSMASHPADVDACMGNIKN